jgi:hypothetical protein
LGECLNVSLAIRRRILTQLKDLKLIERMGIDEKQDIVIQSPNQKIPDRKTKCVIKTHINIKQNVIFGAKLKPV